MPFGDEGHIIYINGAFRDSSTALGRLIADFSCKKFEDFKTPLIAEKMTDYKTIKFDKEGKIVENDKWRAFEERYIAENYADVFAEREAEGEAKGEAKGKLEALLGVAMDMIKKNYAFEIIADICKMPLEKVRELALQMSVKPATV